MRILSRYVFRQTAGALVLIVLSLTGVVWIAVALRQLELLTSQGQDALRFLAMTTLAIPSMMALIAPIALVIAALHVLNRLSGDSELIVMTAGGMPTWTLFKPLAMLAFLVAMGVSLVNHMAGPWAQQKLKELAVQVRTDLMSQVIQPWRFTSPEAKMTVHIRDRSPAGELLGLLMHDGRDPKQVVTYLAERGQIIKQAGAAYLRMEKGHIIRRLPNEPAPQIVAFEGYAVDLNQLEQRVEPLLWLKARERYTTELLRPNQEDPIYKSNPGSFTAELHERFAAPLYAFMFVLLVLAFMGQAQTTRTTRMQALVSCFTVAIGCRILGIGAANAVVARPAMSALLYAVPLGAGLMAAMAVQWRMYPRRPTRITRALRAASNRAGEAMARLSSRPAATVAPSAPARTRG